MRAIDVRRDIARAIEDIDEVRSALTSELERPHEEEFVSDKYVSKIHRAVLMCYDLRNELRELLG